MGEVDAGIRRSVRVGGCLAHLVADLANGTKHLKLATISVLYSVSLVLLLTAIGVVLFRESLNYFEVIGIVLAVISLVLLMRFA